MHNESLVSKSISRRLAGVLATFGALTPLLATSGCGERFSCKEARTCQVVAGAGGEEASANGDGDGTSTGGAHEGGAPSGSLPDDCEPGTFSCQGQVVLQCQSNTWTQVGTCPFACLGSGECGGECVPDARDCDGNTPRLCTAEGAWKELEACPDACSGEGNCIGQCIPDSKDCLDGAPRTCSAEGEWQEAAACPFVCTGAGECTGECAPEDGKCEGNVPYLCHEAGVWIAQPACEKVCSGKGECTGACTPGDKECSGNKPRTCNDQGEWDEQAACDFVCTGAGECTGDCVPGAKACDGYGFKTCSAAGAYVHSECPTAAPVCSGDGVCGGSCVDGTQTIDYEPSLVGECCTTTKGTGFLARTPTNASTLNCIEAARDLALNKTATASSHVTANPPGNVTDADLSSLWKASTSAVNEWVRVDFGTSQNMKGVVFKFEQAAAYGYKVETSATGTTWTLKASGTSAADAGSQDVSFPTSPARYVRVTLTSLPAGKSAALSSVRIYN